MILENILKKQNSNGSFSINKKDSPLYSAFILYLLNQNDSNKKIKKKIVDFLLSQKNATWTFNYWSREHKNKEELIPDDLFTSTLTWLTLYEYNPKLFTAEDLGTITQSLTFLEINEGGPYRNWLVATNSNEKWLSTKYSSNFILAKFLKILDIELDNLNNFLKIKINFDTEYLSQNLIQFFNNEKINTNNFYWEFPNNQKFEIELNLNNFKKEKKDEIKIIGNIEKKIINTITNQINNRLKVAGLEIFEAISPSLDFILSKENAILEILLLPYFFAKSFDKNTFSEELLIELGLANLWGWLAYTIYDDFLDDEGQKIQLSAANLALREVSQIFNNLDKKYPNKKILETFHEAMDTVDSANTWEVKNCRVIIENNELILPEKLPDYQDFQNLHERSIGHGMGPFVLSFINGDEKKSEKFKNLYKFIQHYIITKQLNDDVHDFWDDLSRGQLNSVVTEVLKIWKHKYPNKNIINLKKDKEELQNIFINNLLEKLVLKIQNETKIAKESLNKFSQKENKILENFLKKLEKSANQTLKDKVDNAKFLKSYRK